MDSAEFMEALREIVKEKGIDEEVIYEAIETSLVSACKKNFGTSQNVKVVMDRETGNIEVYAQKDVVEEVEDPMLQVSLEEAKAINPVYQIGDVVDFVVTPKNFGRISAQTAKQVVVQKFREAEREILFNQYISKEKEVVIGIVQRTEKKNVIVQLGKIDAILAPNEQIPGEQYRFMDRVKVYVVEVKQTTKGPQIFVSRTHPELVKRLFEQEVPEVFDGTGEKIDIVNWSEDPKEFIAAALSPSKVLAVAINPNEQSARIVVPDHQLSLAIGKEGQNARLSAKLTGWRIDIKSESQAKETGFITEDGEFPEEALAENADERIDLDKILETEEQLASETEEAVEINETEENFEE